MTESETGWLRESLLNREMKVVGKFARSLSTFSQLLGLQDELTISCPLPVRKKAGNIRRRSDTYECQPRCTGLYINDGSKEAQVVSKYTLPLLSYSLPFSSTVSSTSSSASTSPSPSFAFLLPITVALILGR